MTNCSRLSHVACSCFLAGVTLLSTGCEDAAARKRNEVQAAINDASAKLRTAVAEAVDADNPDKARSSFQSVLTTLNVASSGEPGQQAAAALLSAVAHRELAQLAIYQVNRLEFDQAAKRQVLAGMVDAALRLDSAAQSLAARDAATEKSQLSQRRTATEGEIVDVSRQLAALDGPIQDLLAANARDQEEVRVRLEEANQLMRQAATSGHAAGFTTYERAIDVRRQADRANVQIAHREIELDNLQPDHERASFTVEQLRIRQSSIDAALAQLNEMVATLSGEAGKSREAVAGLKTRVSQMMGEMDTQSTGDLEKAYSQAVDHLERAVTEGNKSAGQGGRDAGSGRLVAAHAQEMLASLLASRASAADAHLEVMKRIQGANSIFNNAQAVSMRVGTLTTQANESREKAAAALTGAIETLSAAGAAGSDAELQSKLNTMLVALTGQPEAEPDAGAGGATPPTSRPTGSGAAVDQGSGEGFASAEELVAFLDELDTRVPTQAEMNRIYHASTPAGRSTIAVISDLNASFGPFAEALIQQFGADALTELPDGSGQNPLAVTQPQLSDVTETTANLTGKNPQGVAVSMALINTPTGWKINMDQLDATTRQMLSAINAMAGPMRTAVNKLIPRIRAGEFQDIEEVTTALIQSLLPPGMTPPTAPNK